MLHNRLDESRFAGRDELEDGECAGESDVRGDRRAEGAEGGQSRLTGKITARAHLYASPPPNCCRSGHKRSRTGLLTFAAESVLA